MALEKIGSFMWAPEYMDGYVDISGLTNYRSASAVSQDVASCENSAIIRAEGDSSKYPAVWTAREYKTAGTDTIHGIQILVVV